MLLQWWPGVVDTPVREADNDIRRGEEGQIVYHVDYEAFDEFAPERCQVSFLNQRAYGARFTCISLRVWHDLAGLCKHRPLLTLLIQSFSYPVFSAIV